MKLFLLLLPFLISIFFPNHIQARESIETNYFKGKVEKVISTDSKQVGKKAHLQQKLQVKITEGLLKNNIKELPYGDQRLITKEQELHQGDIVIIAESSLDDKKTYTITDKYRLPTIGIFSLLFFGLVLLIIGRKGIGSIIGLCISLLIIALFIVPQILAGQNPLFISIVGAVVIMITTIYLAHGFNQRTTIAVTSTAISLFLTGILAIISVKIAGLSGLGSEDAYNLFLDSTRSINLQGLLLGGIIIGSLGVLDDTTTTQSTTVLELAKANEKLSVKDLYARGMVVGKEHISSLVNTLVLAYAGASLGIFIFIIISLQNNTYPWWVIFNSELLSEEIVRTLAGSIGLILAVPITTIIAAFFAKNEIKIK